MPELTEITNLKQRLQLKQFSKKRIKQKRGTCFLKYLDKYQVQRKLPIIKFIVNNEIHDISLGRTPYATKKYNQLHILPQLL